MHYITIERMSENKLTRQGWRFNYFENEHTLILDGYTSEVRESKLHKRYVIEHRYDRVLTRSNTLAEREVPLPVDVIKEAREQFCATLKGPMRWSYFNDTRNK